jgi:hypothetical protein
VDEYDKEAFRIAQVVSGKRNPDASWVADARTLLPHPPTPGFRYAKQASLLIEIMRGPTPYPACKGALREVGIALFKLGGFAALQSTAAEVRQQFPQGERKPDDQCFGEGDDYIWHPQYIDYSWDGIGPWKP